MDKLFRQNGKAKQNHPAGRLPIVLGLLLLWGAGIGFGFETKTLLTPGNYQVGSDPSFDICAAVFCFFLCLMGGLLIWRGLLGEDRMDGKQLQYLNTATLIDCVILALVFIVGGMVFSANRTAAAQYKPILLSQPGPDSSLPLFPTPGLSLPTPTYDPSANYLAGPIKSAMNGLRVGDMWISASRADGSIYTIQVFMDRISCSAQEGNQVTTYAVEKSLQLFDGPVKIRDGSFYAGASAASVHGIMVSPDQAHGTLYLRYTDPASQRSCDLGSFTWSASSTTKDK